MYSADADAVRHEIVGIPEVCNRSEEADDHVSHQTRLETNGQIVDWRFVFSTPRFLLDLSQTSEGSDQECYINQ